MKKMIIFLWIPLFSFAQFSPPAGENGSDAIHKDSSIFVAWAEKIHFYSIGYQQINNTSLGFANTGDTLSPLGKADLNVLSLGDGGEITLYFHNPIFNGTGNDFAVFENSFSDNFLELAFVEVSTNGIDFVRFPSICLNDTSVQIGTFGTMDTRKILLLAGKYRANYGTPFDLEILQDSQKIDIQNIHYVRVIDVIGSLDPNYRTYDSAGNPINDPFPTPFPSSGFDLDAVGVIHQKPNSLSPEKDFFVKIYPNPTRTKQIMIQSNFPELSLKIFDFQGNLIWENEKIFRQTPLNFANFASGIYQFVFQHGNQVSCTPVVFLD